MAGNRTDTDDNGFTADRDFADDVLWHAGMVLRRTVRQKAAISRLCLQSVSFAAFRITSATCFGSDM
nr:Atu4866 domain-containing protein [Agrobacterium tumefaciens]